MINVCVRPQEGASILDLLLAVRADEACHSHVNHTFSDMKASDKNPVRSLPLQYRCSLFGR